MASRPMFYVSDGSVRKKDIDFTWYSGFAVSQKQKSIRSLHENIRKFDASLNPLEISTKSEIELGRSLSAFNLKLDGTYLENVFQSSKVFEEGGPFRDLLSVSPKDAKHDERLQTSGKLVSFEYAGNRFPLEPKTVFYDYLYIKAVLYSEIDYERLEEYNGFTDIEFNPKRSINTQARSAAIIRLLLNDKIDLKAVSDDPEQFIKWHRTMVLC